MFHRINIFIQTHRVQVFVVIIALLWKGIWLFLNSFTFNADEAIVGLMAKHILQGERPPFFYGQSYMGGLDAYLVSIGFLVFGIKVWVIRFVQTFLYLSTIIVVIEISKLIFHNELIGLFTGLLLAIPTVNVLLYTTVSLGGYGEALFLGSLIIFLWLKLESRFVLDSNKFTRYISAIIFLGFLISLGIWVNAITLVFSIPVVIAFFFSILHIKEKRKILLFFSIFVMGFILGLIPFWIAAVKSGFNVFIQEMFGSAVSVEKVGWLARTITHIRNLLILGIPVMFGFRPPWGVIWLAIPLIPFVLAIWIFPFVKFRSLVSELKEKKNQIWLIIGIIITLFLGFIFTSFGVDPSGRYFIPLAIPFSILLSSILVIKIKKPLFMWIMIGTVLLFNILSTIQCGVKKNPGFTTQFYEPSIIDHSYDQALIQFLQENNATRGYTNYWVSYPLAFLSDEKLIFIPRLPYHLDQNYTGRDDRYAKYDGIVQNSETVAYITTRNPDLDKKMTLSLQQKGIRWSEKVIGDFHIYYQLSQRVSPEDLGISGGNSNQ
jgi:4-amino-4-deoxy-L-arabinose transferase-like glycosyltransferase